MGDVWTVRGVRPEFRKLARSAAVGVGVPVGRWLESAIELVAGVKRAAKKLPKTEVIGVVTEYVEHPAHTVIPPYTDYEGTSALGPALPRVRKIEHAAPILPEAPPVEEPAAKKGRTRSCCQHGTEKGYNCWQCGGLAVIR